MTNVKFSPACIEGLKFMTVSDDVVLRKDRFEER